MGNLFNKQNPKKIVIWGLGAAGKTTLLYRLKLGEIVTTIPTIGFNQETIAHKNVSLIMMDVHGGNEKFRKMYHHYYQNSDVMIFVVDSADTERLPDAKEELNFLTEEDELWYASFLVLANKQDLTNAMTPEYIAEALEISKIRQKCHIQGISVLKGDGINEALDWVIAELNQKQIENSNFALRTWERLKGLFAS